MATTFPASPESATDASHGPRLDHRLHPAGRWIFLALLAVGVGYAGYSIIVDTAQVGEGLALGTFAFLGLALLIALGFEFVNGFHDTANAVATVIYTHSMPAALAVVWSGFFNFLGVMLSSGAVAYSIITLLPVDLILHVGSNAGFAMIFALLLAAVLWNLGTWYVGLPNSSSHALIGSILGVGLANQLMTAGTGGTSGVDWSQATKVLTGLWMAPLIGFGAAFLLLHVMKLVLRNPKLYSEPEGTAPPPKGIRALLIFTCTAVSFAHGGNDGQKGMGLIMLILIGCAPTAYALNRTMPQSETPAFVASANAAAAAFATHAGSHDAPTDLDTARTVLTRALQARHADTPQVFAAADALSRDLGHRIGAYGSLDKVPAAATPNLRNDMYLVLDSARLATKDKEASAKIFSAAELTAIKAYQTNLEKGTRYIPVWVKVIVALALGLGTMVGWRRIVITVGEKIGKSHLTYGMGASAELVAAGTILAAEVYGLPVSTTHILSSGVAGASVASGAGLQPRTIGSMALAWVLTLPAAMALAGGLYWVFLGLTKM
ncbi:MAG: inorganic phosphate transporter [Sphingomonas sp.]|uniref:inorganic phosphate transporter n=1 Tax=Sphingomonas sp. TaxID=28214 RepID=UPI0030F96BAA